VVVASRRVADQRFAREARRLITELAGPNADRLRRAAVALQLAEIADRALGSDGPLNWTRLKDHDEIRGLIAKLVPDLEQMDSVGRTKQEFHIPGRILHQPSFKTPSGRASFKPHPLPDLAALGERQLRLMTVRSEGQFNTVVYEEEDLYRGQERRDVILMNVADIARMGLKHNEAVNVTSEAGVMPNIIVREYDIAAGCALMYYPEANVLIGRAVDPRSKTPSFKSVVVNIGSATGTVALISKAELANGRKSSRDDMKAC